MDTRATTQDMPATAHRELSECHAARERAYKLPEGSDEQRAARSVAIAETFEAEAATWGRMAEWVYSPHSEQYFDVLGPAYRVFGRAVVAAHAHADEFARWNRDHARWAAKQAGRTAVTA